MSKRSTVRATKLGRSWTWYLLTAYVLAFAIDVSWSIAIFYALNVSGFAARPYENALFAGLLGFGMGMIFIPIYFLSGKLEFHKKEFVVGALLMYWVLLGAAVGMFRGNSLLYTLADVTFVAIGVIGYALTRAGNVTVAINARTVKWFAVIGWVMVGFAVLGLHSTLPSLLLILVAVFACCLFAGDVRGAMASSIPLVILIPFNNRATVLVIAGVIIVTIAVMTKQGRLHTLLKTTVLLTILFITVLFLGGRVVASNMYEFDQTYLGSRIEKTQEVFAGGDVDLSEDVAIERRLYEASVVVDSLGSNPLNWVLGMGPGATVDLSLFGSESLEDTPLLGAEDVHAIHLLPLAVLYRYGFVGLFFLVVVTIWLTRVAFRANNPSAFGAAIAGLSIILYSMPASGYLFREPLLWFSLAWIVNLNAAELRARNSLAAKRPELRFLPSA